LIGDKAYDSDALDEELKYLLRGDSSTSREPKSSPI